MLRFLLVSLIFVLSLHAISDTKLLQRADGLIKSKNKSDNFRAYNDYKNLYLQSVMSGDSKLRTKSLEGIVKSGQKLNIDVARYEKELKQIKDSKKTTSQSKQIKQKQSSHI
jgi:N-acetylmuramoyl-L-alanine amidase